MGVNSIKGTTEEPQVYISSAAESDAQVKAAGGVVSKLAGHFPASVAAGTYYIWLEDLTSGDAFGSGTVKWFLPVTTDGAAISKFGVDFGNDPLSFTNGIAVSISTDPASYSASAENIFFKVIYL